MEEFQFVPPLFMLLCFGIGAALFVTPFLWLYQVSKDQTQATLANASMLNALRVLFVVSVWSIFYNYANAEANIVGEGLIVAMMVVIMGAYGVFQKRSLFKLYFAAACDILFSVVVTVLFFFSTVMAGFVMMKAMIVFNDLAFPLFPVPLRHAVFLTGILWVGLLFFLYRACRKKELAKDEGGEEGESAHKPIQFQNILWPLAVALIFIMIPLVVEQKARDGDFDPEPPKTVLRKA